MTAVSLVFTLIATLGTLSSGQTGADGAALSGPSGLTGPYLGQMPPGNTPKLFAPGIVSTCHEHSAAMVTPDGNEIWFGRLFPAAIYYVERREGGWTAARVAPFSGQYVDLYPYLTREGDRLIFTSLRPIRAEGEALPPDSGHLWMAVRDETGLQTPQYLGTELNMTRRLTCGSIGSDGSMYLSTGARADGMQSMDLYVSKATHGRYGTPIHLGNDINSPQPDSSPCIAHDGSYIIFSSFRGGFGRSDLFISFRSGDGSWTEPKNLGESINSSAKDEHPYLTPDGKYLFFNSNRMSALNSEPVPDGPGNVYWVDAGIVDGLKPPKSPRR